MSNFVDCISDTLKQTFSGILIPRPGTLVAVFFWQAKGTSFHVGDVPLRYTHTHPTSHQYPKLPVWRLK